MNQTHQMADQITIDGESYSVLSQDSFREVAAKFPELAAYWDEQNILARLELVDAAGRAHTGYLFPDGRVQLIGCNGAAPREKNPLREATKLAETWYGRPAETLTEVDDNVLSDAYLADLGRLVELEILPPGGKGDRVVCLRFELRENVRLASSEDGRQLHIVGRVNLTQPVLRKFGLRAGELDEQRITLGEIALIAYHAAKHTHQFRPSEYGHKMGEEGGLLPVLIWDRPNKELVVSGGSYRVEDVGLVN